MEKNSKNKRITSLLLDGAILIIGACKIRDVLEQGDPWGMIMLIAYGLIFGVILIGVSGLWEIVLWEIVLWEVFGIAYLMDAFLKFLEKKNIVSGYSEPLVIGILTLIATLGSLIFELIEIAHIKHIKGQK